MLTLITGGIKSGKSAFALSLAEKLHSKENCYFIATAIPSDPEIKERIKNHRKNRNKCWNTIEESEYIDRAVETLLPESVVIVDCITLWAGNIVCRFESDPDAPKKAEKIIENLFDHTNEKKLNMIIVTNEVGGGIIPDNKLSRAYGDFLGKINQKIARAADEVQLMVSGINIKLKDGGFR